MELKILNKYSFEIILSIVILVGLLACNDATSNVSISAMRCEYIVNPIGLDSKNPRFTWIYNGVSMEGVDKFQIEISMCENFSSEKSWTLSLADVTVRPYIYDGKDLEPNTLYYWRVILYNNEGKLLYKSPKATFETGLMSNENWVAHWISDSYSKEEKIAPMFRKSFSVEKKLEKARLYVSAAGYYKMFVNGSHLDINRLDPGYTHYDCRNYYVTYDIIQYLKDGTNALGFILGNGFYNEIEPVATWDFEKARWRNRPRMIAELILTYSDGTKSVISTDESWKTALSEIVSNNIYSGDICDQRREIKGWSNYDFIDEQWQNAVIVKAPSPILIAQEAPAIKVEKKIEAVDFKQIGDTIFVYDMGTNLSGVCEFTVQGHSGTKLTFSHGELLKSNGRIEMGNLDIYYKSLPGMNFQTDTYILPDAGTNKYTPDFSYHGFRYVEVKSDRPVKMDKNSVKALFFHTDVRPVGKFECSNDLLNKIWSATNQTYLCNLMSIPTDCPQREKNGWTADAHIAIDIALMNFDGIKFYEKWIDDIIDNQRQNGSISGIIPSSGWGYDDWIGPVWDAAMFIIPDALYQYYGDERAIEKIYPVCERYLRYLQDREDENGTVTYGIGDWVPYKTKTPTDYTTTCFYYWDNVLMARFASILGKDDSGYKNKAERLKNFINEYYYNKLTAEYSNGSQTAQSIALALNIVQDAEKKRVADHLNKMIVDNGYHLDFGVLGSKYVPRMLTKYGYANTVYKMVSQDTAPSWGYWIKEGYTTLPETWIMSHNFADASLNHVFLGDISTWMMRSLGGINIQDSKVGLRHVSITPNFVEGLDWVKCSYSSVNGEISTSWKRESGKIILKVIIPVNVTATVYADKNYEIIGGKHEFNIEIGQ